MGHHGVVSFPDHLPSSATTDESDMETSATGMGEAKEGDVGGELPMEGCWRHFSDLCELLPGRRPQIELLLTLFGEVSVHINGSVISQIFTGSAAAGFVSFLSAWLTCVFLTVCVRPQWHRQDPCVADCTEEIGGNLHSLWQLSVLCSPLLLFNPPSLLSSPLLSSPLLSSPLLSSPLLSSPLLSLLFHTSFLMQL